MQFARSHALAPYLVVLGTTGSTNAELMARAGVPDFCVVATLDQHSGRGRLGREWSTPPGTALAVSVLVPGPADGWLPLRAGLAMTEAVLPLVAGPAAGRVELKWPNDVLVGGRKVSGILCEVAPDGRVVVGAGVNLTMSDADLPVPTATSLTLEGADPHDLADIVLSRYLSRLFSALQSPAAAVQASASVRELCGTIGRRVRVELPGGAELHGTATGIDDSGRLEVRDDLGRLHALSAGDVHHLRADSLG